MREILFRAKSKNSGRWVYGDLITQKYKSRQGIHIYEKNDSFGYQFVRINKKTLGQYTGLADKNGTKIFEGDIVGCFCNTQIFQVKWCDVRGGYFLDDVIMCGGSEPAPECLGNLVDTIEVIGNIYDNKVGDFSSGS